MSEIFAREFDDGLGSLLFLPTLLALNVPASHSCCACKTDLLTSYERELERPAHRIRGDLTRFNPVFVVNRQRVFLDPANLATIRPEHLGDPVLNLESDRHRIIAALDLVFTGI